MGVLTAATAVSGDCANPACATPSTKATRTNRERARVMFTGSSFVRAPSEHTRRDRSGLTLLLRRRLGCRRGRHLRHPRVHLLREVRDDPELPLDEHQLRAMVHFVLLRAEEHLEPALVHFAGRAVPEHLFAQLSVAQAPQK